MKMNINELLHKKFLKRIISGVTSLVIVAGVLPLGEFSEELGKISFELPKALADEEPKFSCGNVTVSLADFAEYSDDCMNFPLEHQHDHIMLTYDGVEVNFVNGFKGLGTDGKPFAGSLSMEPHQGADFELILDAPLFNYVYDDVEVKNLSNTAANNPIKIASKIDVDTRTTPLFAQNVIHKEGSSTVHTWYIDVVKPTDTTSSTLDEFGGLIGTMNEGAKANLVVTMKTLDEDTAPAVIHGSGNLGFFCGTMEASSELTASLDTGSGYRGIESISTSGGNAGGLVGQMASTATFTYSSANPQGSAGTISASGGYAGGVVGKNDGGTVRFGTVSNGTFTASSSRYQVRQTISGSNGAGGIFGYYETSSNFNADTYDINCKVNGTGHTGGLFGELKGLAAIELSGTNTITSEHTTGDAKTYGGLIGQYTTANDYGITVSSMTASTNKSGGKATYYGGAIGRIADSKAGEGDTTVDVLVHAAFSSFTATSLNAGTLTYGGLVGSAKKAYIDVAGNTKITASGFKGGGLVGDLGDGVLYIDGSVDLSAATPTADGQSVGKVVGVRDNALVIREESAALSLPSAAVDNIGSWGDVIAFDALFTVTSGKSIVIKAPSAAADTAPTVDKPYRHIRTADDYAVTALCFQIDASKNPYVSFANTTDTYDTISAKSIFLEGDVDLGSKGFRGLTRDNDTEGDGTYCTFSGTFDGTSASAITEGSDTRNEYKITYGGGVLYRHNYNGLFAIADGATVQNTYFDGTLKVNAQDTMYVGAAAATAAGDFTVKKVTVKTTFEHESAEGAELVIGGVLGGSDGDGTLTIGDSNGSAGNITVNASICNPSGSTGGSSGDVYLGGVIGRISHNKNEAETWNFYNVTVTGSIKNGAAQTYNRVGGLVAFISGYSNSTATYASRALNLNTVNIQGLSIEVNASENGAVGGLLGYAWRNVDVDFNAVSVSGSSIKNTSTAEGIDFAGLVYNGTGHWTADATTANSVTTSDIDIASFTLYSDNAESFGMIVNKGWYADDGKTMGDGSASALYLELCDKDAYKLASGVSFKKKSSTSTDMDIHVFDELVAYTAYYTGSGASKHGYAGTDEDDLYIIRNGQGIVSIQTATNTGGGLTMNGSSASGTYTPVTAFGRQMNPYSRYYYNLNTIANGSSNADKLMRWGARWYAHNSIKKYISDNGWGTAVGGSGAANTDEYNMAGYSWYPLNIDSANVTIKGTFKLWNKEFEGSETAANTADSAHHSVRSSLYSGGTSQHFLMHSALFYNVNGKLTADVVLQGSVPQIDTGNDKYSGALVLGLVKGTDSDENNTAKVSTTNVKLDGIYVWNFVLFDTSGETPTNYVLENYAPLLINKSGEFSTLSISNVTVKDGSSYPSSSFADRKASYSGDADPLELVKDNTSGTPKIATSLIGNVGQSAGDYNVSVSFSNIQLDGRKTNTDLSAGDISALDTAYHTSASLFTQSTLVTRYMRFTGHGTYNYTLADDWTQTSGENVTPITYSHNVTYGKEVGYTDTDPNTEYPGQEQHYLNADEFVNPKSGSDTTGSYTAFTTSYLPYVYKAYHKDNSPDYHQLAVNHETIEFSGCGTYNDPYILTDGTDFVTISKILNDDCEGQKIWIPTKQSSGNTIADLTETWSSAKVKYVGHSDGNFYIADANDEPIVASNVNNVTYNCLSNIEVRTYVAGAYFKLDPSSDDNKITIESTADFIGLGNTTDKYAHFRGVIVGDKTSVIENKTNYPLIAISNGSVVKDVNITVDKSTTGSAIGTINLSLGAAKTYDAIADASSQYVYGAVMGTVLGGDNIIDGVTVTFNNTTINLSGSHAQLIPVGGYVGSVVNGGVIFRGMESKRGNEGIAGIPSGIVTVDTTNGEMTSSDNKRWLYVNPIIGRVINGYAVTEADAYRPFEDGTRTYGDETVEYWLETKSGNTITSSVSKSASDKGNAVGVTMRNGNKNYSIADISSGEAKLNTKGTNSVIEVPNGQAFFIMSLVVNSGMSQKQLGYNQAYQMSRTADYDSVATNTSASASSCSDYNNKAKNDKLNTSDNTKTDKRGYLYQNYTLNNNQISNADKSLKLTTQDGKYYLPDGYKGIGNLYNNDDSTTTEVNENDYYRMKITSFTGNGATISQNTYYYFYDDKDTEYPPNTGLQSGLGLINYYTAGSNGTFRDFYLTGNVKADLINTSDGSFILTKTAKALDTGGTGAANSKYLSVGTLIGTMAQNLTVKNVSLQNIDVLGLRATGGLIGYIPDKTLTYEIESTVATTAYNSNRIKVHGRASTGGLVGKIRAGYAKVDMNGHTFNLSEVVCECQDRGGDYWDYGVGGFVGMMRAGANNIDGNIETSASNYFKNIVIGTENDAQKVTCKEGAEIFTAGVVGIMNKCKGINIENCKFYNLSVEAKFAAAGLVAFPTTYTPAVVTNTHLYSPLGSTIESTTDYAGGLIGSSDPRRESSNGSQNFTFDGCSVDNYTISGKNGAGGVIGFRGAYADSIELCINNSSVTNCTIKSDDAAGGLIGEMISPVVGYNLLARNIAIDGYSNDAPTYSGYICGSITENSANVTYNTTGNYKPGSYMKTNQETGRKPFIKIAGFSRQADDLSTMEADLVGACNYGTGYGDGGYVIFADYSGTQSNEAASHVNDTNNQAAASPYITVNPKNTHLNIKNDSSTGFITGDGSLKDSYSTIINDSTSKKYSFYKRYSEGAITTDTLSADDKSEIARHLSDSSTVFPGKSIGSFPLLVIDDTTNENTTRLLNNYINVLANTAYNYAAEKNSVYNVDFIRYKYENDGFVESGETASMSRSDNLFKMNPASVDTSSSEVKFTLMDVQFMDPSTPAKIAYHLYIPLYVKRVLIYDVSLKFASNTEYNSDAYRLANNDYMFENFGNPVTFRAEFKYDRDMFAWASAVSEGDSVLTNYSKYLTYRRVNDLTNANTDQWPEGTKLVLVDVKAGKEYYWEPEGNGTLADIEFKNFKAIDGTTAYSPVAFQELLSPFYVYADADGTLMVAESESVATVKGADGQYYRRINDDDTPSAKYSIMPQLDFMPVSEGGSYIRLNNSTGATAYDGTYYYRVATNEDGSAQRYSCDSSIGSEVYYLSIFTPKDKASNSGKIYNMAFDTPKSFEKPNENDTVWRPNARKSGVNTLRHLFMGDLYENDLKVDVSSLSGEKEMGSDNYLLNVKMTSVVSLTQSARNAHVDSNLSAHKDEIGIYQTFLMTYDKQKEGENTSTVGLEPKAKAWLDDKKYYLRAGGTLDTEFTSADSIMAPAEPVEGEEYADDFDIVNYDFLEMRSNQNLASYLGESSNNYRVALCVEYKIGYSSALLSEQFPVKSQGGDASVGAKVIGYSNISSSKDGALYTAASIFREDHEKTENGTTVQDGYRYYTTANTKAKLKYNVIQTDPGLASEQAGAGLYGGELGYLGVNEKETGGAASFVDTYASYDLTNMQDPGDFIKLTIRLSSKQNGYLDPTSSNYPDSGDANSANALTIGDYIQNLKVYGKNIGVDQQTNQPIMDVLYDQSGSTANADSRVDEQENLILSSTTEGGGKMITLVVKKELLRSEEGSGLYYIPVSFEVKQMPNGGYYSNYRVSVTAEACTDIASDSNITDTFATDYLIYTDAKIESKVIR